MELDISSESKRFKEHLSPDENRRILFSGIFGIGKTYFLEKFFEENAESYETFLLEPVNYSISKNDDIISYIKYDLSFELLKKGVEFEKTDHSLHETLPFYWKNHFVDIVQILAKNSGKIGKGLNSVIEIIKKIKEHNEDLKIDEKKLIEDFIKETTQKESSIFHENLITELLSEKIQSFSKSDKKTVLVIEDLDRIDPEHIFRLLNVFASHVFDENKFGFDKVVLVCDINNIKNIFASKYGQDTDFSGYIDKFFSKEVFMFNNKRIVIDSISDILRSMKLVVTNSLSVDSDIVSHDILNWLLRDFVLYDLINLRSLLKNVDNATAIQKYTFSIEYESYSNLRNPIFVVFDFLILLFGSLSNLELVFNKYDKKNEITTPYRTGDYMYNVIVGLADVKNNKFNLGNYTYENKEEDFFIGYEITNSGYDKKFEITKYKKYSNDEAPSNFPFSFFIKKAFIEYTHLYNNRER